MVDERLVQPLKALCLSSSGQLFVAVSGGIDSMVLLFMLHQVLEAHDQLSRLQVIHVDHGLFHDATGLLQSVCSSQGWPLTVVSLSLDKQAANLEAKAREARYEAFDQHISKGEQLLTAHHLSDQAETVLMRLARGAGVDGLSGIPVRRALAGGAEVYRPWLSVPKSLIESYQVAHEVPFIQDDSNTDERFLRNWVRGQVLPLLKTRCPDIEKQVARSAEHCTQASALLSQYVTPKAVHCQPLPLDILQGYQPAQRLQVLRDWLKSYQAPLPRAKALHMLSDAIARGDRRPQLITYSGRIDSYQQQLYWVSSDELSDWSEQSWAPDEALKIGRHHFVASQLPAEQRVHVHSKNTYQVRPYQIKDTLYRGEGRSRLCVRKYWTASGIPPWWRPWLPVVVCPIKGIVAIFPVPNPL